MEITLDKSSALEGLIKITLKEADYQPKIQEKVKEYSRKAQLKGFRPGKVPPTLIKKMYGKSILIEEINELLSKSVLDYIKQNEIKIIGDPLPVKEKTSSIDWDNQKEFEFEYEVGLVDTFTIDYSLKIDTYQAEIDEPTVHDTIERLRREYGNYSEPEQSAEGDDYFGELKAEGSEDKTEVWLLHDQLNGDELRKLIGIKKDDTVTLEIGKLFKEVSNLAKVLHKKEEEVKDLAGNYTLKVTRIHRVVPAGLDQEFFDKVFGKDTAKNEEEFRVKVKEMVQKNYDHEAEHYTEHRIQDKLLEATTINIPDNFYKKWILAANSGKITEEELNENFNEYLKDLKWSLIYNRVSDDQGIKVEHEEVVTAAKDLVRSQFAAYGISQTLEENIDAMANNYLKGKEGQNYINVYNRVKYEKVMKFLKEKLEIQPLKANPADFLKAIQHN